ncbi:EAL domain-containing protein [Geminocystis sp. CENA526]|uniref:EAL domain-containing protein n=1 Tax=Geminocystis sp. CENA526 TaxID=1355871 RepID=UPI003D6E7621
MSEVQEFRHILVIEDRKGRRIVSLEESNYTLGRDSHNPIILYDYQVSRTHATLIRKIDDETENFSYRIIDGDLQGKRSTNGILINGHSTISHELKHGDIIRFANDAKASYYIIPTDSGIDLFNPDGLDRINASRITLTNQSSETMIKKQEEATNSEDQQELIRLASFPELSPNPIIELDWDGNITYVNPAASIKFDTIYDEKLEHPILAGLLTEYNNRQGNLFLREVKIANEVFEQYVHYLSEKKLIRCYIFDFTKRKQAEAQLKESEVRYRAIARQTSEGIFLAYASNKRIIEANDSYLKVLGYSNEEITNLTLYNVIASDLSSFNQDLAHVLENKEDFTKQYLHRAQDGSLINLESSISLISYQNKDIFCFVVRNATNTEHIGHFNDQVFHDQTTHLPNQKLFTEQLGVAIANAERYQYLMSLIVIEIEKFSEFKQNNNQNIVDQLVKNFCQTLQSCLRLGDLVARWDENKFMVLFPRIKGPKDPAKIAKKMSLTLEQFLQQYSSNVKLDVNLSLIIYPIDGDELSLLLKNSLLSLESKRNSANYNLTGFNITPKTASLLKLENLIGSAIKEQQFFLCYQPQINSQTRQITGLEALLRWDHPELGKVTPRHFLRLTEETDFMLPLGVWILQTAALQMIAWTKENIPPLPIGVNISARQFSQPNFLETIEKALEQSGLPPQFLELEITENCFLQNQESAYQILSRLSNLKVRLCFDNFGSGNSALIHLQKVAFDTIKISPSVINQLEDNPKQRALIESIAVLCKGYGSRLVAVGIEKMEQMELLRNLGCTEIQGNLFSRPLPPKETTIFLHKAEHTIMNS